MIGFDEGTDLDVLSASYLFETGLGWWQPSLGYADSNSETTRQGLGFEYSAGFAELQWAIMTGPETGIGVNLNYSDSDLQFDFGPFTASETTSQSYGIRVGAM